MGLFCFWQGLSLAAFFACKVGRAESGHQGDACANGCVGIIVFVAAVAGKTRKSGAFEERCSGSVVFLIGYIAALEKSAATIGEGRHAKSENDCDY